MATTMVMWRAEYFEEADDLEPARVDLIEANTETEAAEKAAQQIKSYARVDLTRTVIKQS